MLRTVEHVGWRFTILEDGNVVLDNKPIIDEARRDGRPQPKLEACVAPMPLILKIAEEHGK